MGIIKGFCDVLSILSYLILAAVFGWKYQVLFEMTVDSVTHIQMPRQVKKTETIAWITVIVGAAAHRPTVAGAGLLSTAKSSSKSIFKEVETVKVRRKRNTIHVNQLFDKNQVYAEEADFDFVENLFYNGAPKRKSNDLYALIEK